MDTAIKQKYAEHAALFSFNSKPWEELTPEEQERFRLSFRISAEAVTDRHKEFARAVVELARKHKMSGVTMTFCAEWDSGMPKHDVHMQWGQGRHGCESYIKLTCSFQEHVTEKVKVDGQ